MFFLSLVLGSGGSPYSDYKGTVSKWQYDVGREVRDLEGSMEFSIEVYRHYGLDLMGMKKKGEEHDWGICEKERTEELTGNMAGFGMEHSQRIIIDYDKDYGWTLVRRFKKDAIKGIGSIYKGMR